MQYLHVGIAGFVVLFAVVLLLCILPKRKSYEDELAEYKKSLYYRGTKNNYNMVASDPGLYGEYQISLILERCAQDAKLLHNLYIPYGAKTTEIDLLMIHPVGVFVIESKNFRGTITGDITDTTWTQHVCGHTETFYNPIKQNNTHVYALRRHIGNDVNIHPAVVFGEQCKLKLTGQRAPLVLRQKELQKHIARTLKYGYIPMTKTQVNEIYKQLKPYTKVSGEVKKAHSDAIHKEERQ